jgi:hypothetical protein
MRRRHYQDRVGARSGGACGQLVDLVREQSGSWRRESRWSRGEWMKEAGEEDRRRKVAGTRRNGGPVPNGVDGESWNGGEARRCIDGESTRAQLRQAAVATAR